MNVRDDPTEHRNLAGDPEYASTFEYMRTTLSRMNEDLEKLTKISAGHMGLHTESKPCTKSSCTTVYLLSTEYGACRSQHVSCKCSQQSTSSNRGPL